MGIRAVLTTEQFDELSDDMKQNYKKGDGKYVLDVEGIDDHPKVANLKTAHERTKASVKLLKDAAHGRDVDEDQTDDDTVKVALARMRSRFDFLPDDFDEDAFDALKQAADGKGGQATDEQLQEIRDRVTAKLEKKFGDRHTAEIDPLKTENTKLKGTLDRLVIDGGLTSAMDAADIDPKHKPILLPYLKTKGTIRVEDDDGNMTAVVETDMGPVGLKDWVTEFAGSEEGQQYVAKSAGPGARGGNNATITGKTMKRTAFEALPIGDKNKTISDGVQIVD